MRACSYIRFSSARQADGDYCLKIGVHYTWPTQTWPAPQHAPSESPPYAPLPYRSQFVDASTSRNLRDSALLLCNWLHSAMISGVMMRGL